MAVAIVQTSNPAGVASSANVATYASATTGTASSDRLIAVCVGLKLTGTTITSATIDSGGGDTAMTAATGASFGIVNSQIFYLAVPNGTTANIKVTYSANNPAAADQHISVYSITGASATLNNKGSATSTDMDATSPLTTGSITIPANGGFLAVATGNTDTGTKTWANATEDIDADVGSFRHCTALSTTSGTVTVTCTGSNNGEDGAMSWIILDPGSTNKTLTAAAGSYTLTGTAATLTLGHRTGVEDAGSYALTGTSATLTLGHRTGVQGAGSYALTGTNATTLHAWKLTVDAGSYTLTGTDAVPKKGQKLTVDAGSYALTGTDATFLKTWRVVADAGSYSLSGTNAPTLHGWKSTVDAGSYALTGADATLTLLSGKTIAADAGSYAITGTDATLVYVPAAQGAQIEVRGGGGYYRYTKKGLKPWFPDDEIGGIQPPIRKLSELDEPIEVAPEEPEPEPAPVKDPEPEPVDYTELAEALTPPVEPVVISDGSAELLEEAQRLAEEARIAAERLAAEEAQRLADEQEAEEELIAVQFFMNHLENRWTNSTQH